tara:strand:- start:3947 stop:4753 length:807 start_codon:yes stop_codon:yes gene_type:complete
MPKTTRKLPSFEGVAAGQTASIRLPIGRTYEQLLITYGGATIAQLTELRIVANGEVIHRVTALTKLDSMNKFEGRAAASGVIVFDFNRYGLRTRAGEEFTGLGTGVLDDPNKITTLTAEIDIAAAATSPTLSAKAIQSPPRAVGFIKKTRQFIYTAGASGEFEISDLPKGDTINKIFIGNQGTIGITKVVIERDNFIEFERSVAENSLIQTDGVRVPQSGYVVYDPTEAGNGSESLATAGVQDLRIRLTLTTAGQVPLTVETIGTPEI